jgi:hypothetical protein
MHMYYAPAYMPTNHYEWVTSRQVGEWFKKYGPKRPFHVHAYALYIGPKLHFHEHVHCELKDQKYRKSHSVLLQLWLACLSGR